MPIQDGKYVAPTWVNNAPPALDADELNAMSQSIESAVQPDEAFESANNIGDIVLTKRTDLGDNWFLCNGEQVDNPDNYPDGLQFLKEFDLSDNYILSKYGIIKDYYYQGYDSNYIYVTSDGKLYVVKRDTLELLPYYTQINQYGTSIGIYVYNGDTYLVLQDDYYVFTNLYKITVSSSSISLGPEIQNQTTNSPSECMSVKDNFYVFDTSQYIVLFNSPNSFQYIKYNGDNIRARGNIVYSQRYGYLVCGYTTNSAYCYIYYSSDGINFNQGIELFGGTSSSNSTGFCSIFKVDDNGNVYLMYKRNGNSTSEHVYIIELNGVLDNASTINSIDTGMTRNPLSYYNIAVADDYNLYTSKVVNGYTSSVKLETIFTNYSAVNGISETSYVVDMGDSIAICATSSSGTTYIIPKNMILLPLIDIENCYPMIKLLN